MGLKISIAMCTYNGAQYLQAQLDSIAAQTCLPDELVICDDASSDDTTEVIEAFASRAPFPIRLYVNEENLGSTKNFEKAIGLCRGEIIALADQDDVWHPEKLKRMEAEFASSPHVGLVFSDLEMVDENLRPLGYTAWQCKGIEFDQHEQKLFRKGKALNRLLVHNIVTGSAMAFRSRFRDLVTPIPSVADLLVLHDYWIALIIAAVTDLAFIDEPLVKYRRHANQQMGLTPPPPIAADESRRDRARRRAKLYPTHANLLEPIYEKLSSEGNAAKYGKEVSELEARIAHARVRAGIANKKFINRVPHVLKELFTFRYHLYRHPNSNALSDAARDLLQCKNPSLDIMRHKYWLEFHAKRVLRPILPYPVRAIYKQLRRKATLKEQQITHVNDR